LESALLRVLVFSLLLLLLSLFSMGCVTRSTFDELQLQHDETVGERDALIGQVEKLQIERDSFENQYVGAQESFEDERLTRTTLASDLARVEKAATRLDQDLEAERAARALAAAALADRENQLASVQSTYGELVADLESELSEGQIEIERLRVGLRLNVSQDVLFASGSARLDRIGRDVLVKVAGRLKELDDFIEVRGHTDNQPVSGGLAKRFPSNWELAAARAARVVRLLEEHGVPGDRLAAVSLGQNDPMVPNDTAENRARNRRIEIRLEPTARSDSNPAD
jgi:chemotaxis protein MotB